MNKFKVGDVIEYEFLHGFATYKVICIKGNEYSLKGEWGEIDFYIPYVDQSFDLKIRTEIVNV